MCKNLVGGDIGNLFPCFRKCAKSVGMIRIGDTQRQVKFIRMEMTFTMHNSLIVFFVLSSRASLELEPQPCS